MGKSIHWALGDMMHLMSAEQRKHEVIVWDDVMRHGWVDSRDEVPPGEYQLLWETWNARRDILDTLASEYRAAGKSRQFWHDYWPDYILALQTLRDGLVAWADKYKYERWTQQTLRFWGQSAVNGFLRHEIERGGPNAEMAARLLAERERDYIISRVQKAVPIPLSWASAVVEAANSAGAIQKVLKAASAMTQTRSQMRRLRNKLSIRELMRHTLPSWVVLLWTVVLAAVVYLLW